ncbi:MAG: heavy metal translocating P-type ATPase [Monoglobales bacterium]
MNKKQKKMLTCIVLSIVIIILNVIIGPVKWLETGLFAAAYLIVGHDVLKKGFRGIINRRAFDENFLMAIATVGAIVLGEYTEAAAVMIFYQTGELFQSYAVGKSRRAVSELMDIRPDYANMENESGELIKVQPDEVETGSIIVVLPGEKVPIDGVISEGAASFNTSALTGESVPRDASEGDEVSSGFINLSGVVKVKTSKEFSQSTAAKIMELVENAGERKSKSENFISKFARVYTPAVCIAALAVAIAPPVFLLISGNEPQFSVWIYRALTFLVVSCPCALVMSIPLTFFAGIGGAGRAGVLIKGSNYIETLAGVKQVVFDKTGTMTKGVFKVDAVHHNVIDEQKLLEYAAHAECFSHHPIAASLKKACSSEIDEIRVQNVREISGLGISAEVDGKNVLAGNSKLMQKMNIGYKDCHDTGTIVHVAIDGEYAGHIVITDEIKPDAAEAVRLLKKVGVTKTVMLTGDLIQVAEKVAEKIRVDEVYAELLPQDKVNELEKIIARASGGGKVAFVGDGINDAPVLARADVGIAMGALGSDAAVEAADVVLMEDKPTVIAKSIRISKKCISIVYQNIVFAIGIKLICLLLSAVGIANMWIAIFADVGVMVIAVLNAIRALKV